MKTYFLKFADEAQAIEQLTAFRSIDESGAVWVHASVAHALDVIGTLFRPTGAMVDGEDGIQFPEMAPLDGFHANLAIGELPESLVPFAVTPGQPARVFSC